MFYFWVVITPNRVLLAPLPLPTPCDRCCCVYGLVYIPMHVTCVWLCVYVRICVVVWHSVCVSQVLQGVFCEGWFYSPITLVCCWQEFDDVIVIPAYWSGMVMCYEDDNKSFQRAKRIHAMGRIGNADKKWCTIAEPGWKKELTWKGKSIERSIIQ